MLHNQSHASKYVPTSTSIVVHTIGARWPEMANFVVRVPIFATK